MRNPTQWIDVCGFIQSYYFPTTISVTLVHTKYHGIAFAQFKGGASLKEYHEEPQLRCGNQ